MTVGKETGLTPKQQLFCLEFLKDMNATRSYMEAFKAKQNTAMVEGCKLLRNPKVSTFLQENLKKKFDKAEIDGDWVIKKFTDIVKVSFQEKTIKLKNPETGLYDIEGYAPYDAAAANAALTSLGKYFKLFTDKVEVSADYSLVELFTRSRALPPEGDKTNTSDANPIEE